jgi:SAM-dependent methyltransferase
MGSSPQFDAIAKNELGLPPELESTSLLPWDGIADVIAVLRLDDGDVVVDLACGRGGYGLEIAQRTGAALIGVDFSPVAIARARERGGDRGEFRVGELTATGLPDAAATGVLCVDAMQFADPYAAGLAECFRILEPGGRLVLTGWEPLDAGDEAIPQRLHQDIGAGLRVAGFADVRVTSMTSWRQAERAYWEKAITLDPSGDPAIEALCNEGRQVLTWLDRSRRVLASGRVPSGA